MKWFKVKLKAPRNIQDKASLIEYIFYQSGFKGLVLTEEPECFFFTGYLSLADFEKIKTFKNLIKSFRLDKHIKISVNQISESKWSTSWKKFFKPIKAGQKFIITPSWKKVKSSKNKIVIKIDPGMAFGTGYHPTTNLCLGLLEKYLKPCDSVLDLGTGSGILAIAALKLRARKVLAVDNDSMAIKIARKNIKINFSNKKRNFQVNPVRKSSSPHKRQSLSMTPRQSYPSNGVKLSEGFKNVKERFNLIIANLTFKEISKLASEIKGFLLKDGIFICSGIISEDKSKISRILSSHNLRLIKTKEKTGWAGLVFKKRGPTSVPDLEVQP